MRRLGRSRSSAGPKTSASMSLSTQLVHSAIPDVSRRRRRKAPHPSAPHRVKGLDAFHPSRRTLTRLYRGVRSLGAGNVNRQMQRVGWQG
jgi:hypothetical protein